MTMHPKFTVPAAYISIFAAGSVVLLLAILHFLSPEFAPSRRMVSEYALGDYSWVLSLMFISWAVSSWALAYALRSEAKTIVRKIGLIFLITAGIGQAMASIFDVKHSLHGVAGMIGLPSLAIAATIISFSFSSRGKWRESKKIMVSTAFLIWAGLISTVATVIIMLNGLSRTSGEMTSEVIALNGWANRFLVVICCVWVIIAARMVIQSVKNETLENNKQL